MTLIVTTVTSRAIPRMLPSGIHNGGLPNSFTLPPHAERHVVLEAAVHPDLRLVLVHCGYLLGLPL